MNSPDKALSDRIWWTRKARIEAEQRLLWTSFHANLILFYYSAFSVGTSVYYFKFAPKSEYINFVWILFSILIFCIQCFSSGFQLNRRAGLLKECYEALGNLEQKCNKASEGELIQIREDFTLLLRSCENHESLDYYRAIFNEKWISGGKIDKDLTIGMYCLILISFLSRTLLLAILYLLPFSLFLLSGDAK
ncbi:SLATT domain-containing protein [Lyngbya aestuarii]|uniref:SLATT domain-containing protein n=1 Tax=Lyngbya aestuarii TaxID=118322 RepID=UPI00403E18D8